jgi:predicted dehydrogenase
MSRLTRRGFVRGSVTGLGVLAVGASVRKSPAAGSPAEKVVLALIGAGGRGRGFTRMAAARPDCLVKYVCDVERKRGEGAAHELEKIQGSRPKVTGDMRTVFDDKDVHGVIVATPEQWHGLATVWACQAGKDVYVEKCICRKVEEGRKMVQAAQKHKRIVQAGTQSRATAYAASARKYIEEGHLGDVYLVKVFFMQSGVYGGYPMRKVPDSDPPEGLDWDAWLGPAPERPYNAQVHRGWYGYWDYSGGNNSDAIHALDLARMAVGDPPHPKAVNCYGGRWQFDDGGQMPDCQIVTYEFDKLAMTLETTGYTRGYMQKTPGTIRTAKRFPYWPQNSTRIEIYGTEQRMYLGRHGGGWQAMLADGKPAASQYGVPGDATAIEDFVDCIRTRRQPKANVLQGHFSATLEHLANIAYRNGNRKLLFDGKTEKFPAGDEANKYLKAAGRKHYRMPEEV